MASAQFSQHNLRLVVLGRYLHVSVTKYQDLRQDLRQDFFNFEPCTLKSLSLSFPLKLTDLWITSLLFDLNYKFINGSFAFSPG